MSTVSAPQNGLRWVFCPACGLSSLPFPLPFLPQDVAWASHRSLAQQQVLNKQLCAPACTQTSAGAVVEMGTQSVSPGTVQFQEGQC